MYTCRKMIVYGVLNKICEKVSWYDLGAKGLGHTNLKLIDCL